MDDIEARLRDLAEAFGHWSHQPGLRSAGWTLVEAARDTLPMRRWQFVLMGIATIALDHAAGRPIDKDKLSQIDRLLDTIPGAEAFKAAREAIAALGGTHA